MEQLLGLSQQNFSAGSFLQLKDSIRFQHEDESKDGGWPQDSYWIVGRELLLFRQLDLRSIEKNQRQKVLQRKAEQASPFVNTGHFSQEVDGLVMLWLWDEDLRQSAVSEVLQDYSALSSHIMNLSVVPETIFQSRSVAGEVEQACSTGGDAQVWSNGVLQSSHWIPTSSQNYDGFIEVPWTTDSRSYLFSHESLLWRLGLLMLFLTFFYQVGSVLGAAYADSKLDSRIVDAREQVASVAQVRGQVRRVSQQNSQLMEFAGLPGQLGLLAEFDRLLPASATFLDWDYQDNRIKVVIAEDELSNRRYLEALSGSRWFTDVQVTPGAKPDTAVISLMVQRR